MAVWLRLEVLPACFTWTLNVSDKLTDLDDVGIGILMAIAEGSATTREIQERVHLSRTPVRVRLKTLEGEGFLTRRRVGRNDFFKLSGKVVLSHLSEESSRRKRPVIDRGARQALAALDAELEVIAGAIARMRRAIAEVVEERL